MNTLCFLKRSLSNSNILTKHHYNLVIAITKYFFYDKYLGLVFGGPMISPQICFGEKD